MRPVLYAAWRHSEIISGSFRDLFWAPTQAAMEWLHRPKHGSVRVLSAPLARLATKVSAWCSACFPKKKPFRRPSRRRSTSSPSSPIGGRALEKLKEDGSEDALVGLCKRFSVTSMKGVEDEAEKSWVVDTHGRQGRSDALPAGGALHEGGRAPRVPAPRARAHRLARQGARGRRRAVRERDRRATCGCPSAGSICCAGSPSGSRARTPRSSSRLTRVCHRLRRELAVRRDRRHGDARSRRRSHRR